MSTSTTIEHVRRQTIGTGRTRLLGVAGATLTAVAVWAIEVPLLGIHLLTRFGNAASQPCGIDAAGMSSCAGPLAGWGLLASREMRTPRARTIWTGVAILVLV